MRRRVQWLGHATVVLELGGVHLLTDPALRPRLMHLRRHGPVPARPGPVEAVLISHVHHDHLDRASLRLVASGDTVIVVPAGAAALVRDLGFAAVHEVVAGDVVTISGIEVAVVGAWHAARRHPRAPELPAVGFVTGGIWFAGDTGLHPDLGDLRGRVDVALVPVWGWGTSLGPGHLDPLQAAQAVALVDPAVAVPIHWGTFLPVGQARRHGHLLQTPPREFAGHVGQLAPATRVEVLAPGGVLTLGEPRPVAAGRAAARGADPRAPGGGHR